MLDTHTNVTGQTNVLKVLYIYYSKIAQWVHVQQITGNKTWAVDAIKCTGQAWNVQSPVSDVQYTTNDHSQARKEIMSSTCDLDRKFRSWQNSETPSLITICTVVQNCCKGRSNKYRKCDFWGCCLSETR